MNEQLIKMEFLNIPIEKGVIKIYVYGFHELGAWGQVVSDFNGTVVSSKGYHRKKTIIRTIRMLHESLANTD